MVALVSACSSAYYDPYSIQTSLAYAPRMDSSRKVAEQNCCKPVVLDQGNLYCR